MLADEVGGHAASLQQVTFKEETWKEGRKEETRAADAFAAAALFPRTI